MDSKYVLGGGLEPDFTVPFSAIFHGVAWGISIEVENRGFLWKENCCKLLRIYVQKFFAFYSFCIPCSSCGNLSVLCWLTRFRDFILRSAELRRTSWVIRATNARSARDEAAWPEPESFQYRTRRLAFRKANGSGHVPWRQIRLGELLASWQLNSDVGDQSDLQAAA